MLFSTFERPLHPTKTMDTPPKRKRGAELSVGRRTAMAVEIALAIPPGKTRVPKGILAPLVERYGVGPGYPKKHSSECKAQINETGELDISNKPRSGRPSLLIPTKKAALRKIKENRSFTLRQESDQLKEIGLEYSSSTVRR